jgi:hypothetical protein
LTVIARSRAATSVDSGAAAAGSAKSRGGAAGQDAGSSISTSITPAATIASHKTPCHGRGSAPITMERSMTLFGGAVVPKIRRLLDRNAAVNQLATKRARRIP